MLNVKISTLCAVLAHLFKSKLHTCFFCVIVCGGTHIDVENNSGTKADDEISSVLLTDVVHIGLLN